ncbi:MAG: peptide deformylase [Ruminococcaceae bacterium]|nr:peptide deformylase [Oscillospiraceae bacterium]
MIKPIQKDVFFLRKKAEPVTKKDIPIADDLKDTLLAHAHECVGMAANMIGYNKQLIGFFHEGVYMEMFNPRLVSKAVPYETEEGCLSLTGIRKTTRYRMITVRYQTRNFEEKQQMFMGFSAQIIQHELDHLSGIII